MIDHAVVGHTTVHASVRRTDSNKDAVKSAHLAISGITPYSVCPTNSARRVLWWHQLLFRQPLTVVLDYNHEQPYTTFHDIGNVCRTLAEDGCRVILDATSTAVPEATLKHEHVLEVKPLTRERVEGDAAIAGLMAVLRKADLDDVVWAILGGCIGSYRELHREWLNSWSTDDVTGLVETCVVKQLKDAASSYRSSCYREEGLVPLYALFSTSEAVPVAVCRSIKGVPNNLSHDNVLRATRSVNSDGTSESVMVPATPAMAFVLRHRLQEKSEISLPSVKVLLQAGGESKETVESRTVTC